MQNRSKRSASARAIVGLASSAAASSTRTARRAHGAAAAQAQRGTSRRISSSIRTTSSPASPSSGRGRRSRIRTRATRAHRRRGKLFIAYNCMDCHGADGSGAMGPSLQDGRWHFGGTAGEVFQSIYEGRPDGMPSWGGRIGDDQIWRLVAYVQSLSKGHDVATENFTGKTIARTGH